MAEYLFTNLPQYVKLNSRSEFSSSVVSSGAVLLFTEDGYTLTGKLPDGTFITIGGSSGTDVSDTTATAGTVLGGYDFYDSAGSKTTGTIPTVSASLSANVTTVPAGYISSPQTLTVPEASSATVTGNVVTIPAGYVSSQSQVTVGSAVSAQTITPATSNQIITSGGYLEGDQTILGDANLVGSNILSGVSIFGVPGELVISSGAEVTLGYITSGGAFQPLTFSGTSAYNDGSAVNLSCYTYNLPASSGSSGGSWTSSGVIIGSGVTSSIRSGEIWDNTTINSGGILEVSDTANNTIVNQYGTMNLYAYTGKANDTTVNQYGTMNVHAGTANNTTVNGYMYVAGGTINNTTVDSGEMLVYSGTASNTSVNQYGRLNVGNHTLGSGDGRVFDTTVNSGGSMNVNIGTASNTTINSGGWMSVISGGTAVSNTVNSGGYIGVLSGGTANDVTVSSGGTMTIYSGAVTSNITSMTDAVIINY